MLEVSNKTQLFYCEELVYFVSTVVLKVSIAVMLLRLAQNRYHRYLVLWTIGFNVLCGPVLFFVATFQCWPIARSWDISVKGTCISRPVFTDLIYASAAISLVTDGIFAILPTFLIKPLQMDRRIKISLSLILGLGIRYVITILW